MEALIDVLNRDDNLTIAFLERCFEEEYCDRIFDIILDCSDHTSRLYISNLMKLILNKLEVIEKDRL